MRLLRIGLAQINTCVGDLKGNKEKILHFLRQAKEYSVDLVAFPELAVTGYPPEDLLLKPQFIQDNLQTLGEIAKATSSIPSVTVIIGFVERGKGKTPLYNAAAIIHNGILAQTYCKICLPNYGVFDEKRYFEPGFRYPVFALDSSIFAVSICEDIWKSLGPTNVQTALGGADVIINISASPYHAGKTRIREQMLASRARDNKAVIAYVNLVGGQDELIFDGNSLIYDHQGELIVRGKAFQEDLIIADLDVEKVLRERGKKKREPWKKEEVLLFQKEKPNIFQLNLGKLPTTPKPAIARRKVKQPKPIEEIYQALLLGVKDYVKKNGFKQAVIGLSGGVDSALTAALAVAALGKENVFGISMPSEYSSQETQKDAKRLAENLGMRLATVPIKGTYHSYLELLQEEFQGQAKDATEENLQARVRGNILMALSNKFGWLVLAPGNKSEISMGYCTLYGDMVGGFAVLKDVPKTLVYELANHINERGKEEIIPRSIIEREPSAELGPGQKDTDVLPPYPILDPILQAYVEEDKSFQEILDLGFDKTTVKKVISAVDRNEYKRRQAPPGIKITPRAFGKDRRFPITNKYRSY